MSRDIIAAFAKERGPYPQVLSSRAPDEEYGAATMQKRLSAHGLAVPHVTTALMASSDRR